MVEKLFGDRHQHNDGNSRREDPYVQLARRALEHFVRTGKVLDPPGKLSNEAKSKGAGVFVSIKKDGQIRGCMGTTKAVWENVEQEIIHNAISAGTKDPRFLPVEKEELVELVYSVDILKGPELIHSMDELDVKRYGVIAKCKDRSGLLLPNIDGVDTPVQQVEAVLNKAGIHHGEAYSLEKFEVSRHV